MPKRSSAYEPDDFVVDDADTSHAAKRKKHASGDTSATNERKVKTGKQPVDQGKKRDDNGDEYWELSSSGTRRVTINEFKGNTMVNLREYYEQNGKKLPGKKGISMPVDQFIALVEALPQLEKALAKRGEKIPRPNYEGGGEAEDEEDADNEDNKDGIASSRAGKMKKNFEATSDEGEDE